MSLLQAKIINNCALFRVFRSRDFILGETLGEGFFGHAIKVTHRQSGEIMCLKVLNTLDDEAETGFLKEVLCKTLLCNETESCDNSDFRKIAI